MKACKNVLNDTKKKKNIVVPLKYDFSIYNLIVLFQSMIKKILQNKNIKPDNKTHQFKSHNPIQ